MAAAKNIPMPSRKSEICPLLLWSLTLKRQEILLGDHVESPPARPLSPQHLQPSHLAALYKGAPLS